ncbi:MAG: 2-C-methyl-D-erythritol 4-phosphate cytidylyltransferase [Sedimenticola sp.]
MSHKRLFWAVVPAAGVGRRMGGEIPKQYLRLNARRVIEHAMVPLLADSRISRVLVALSEDDGWWADTSFSNHPRVQRVNGGTERCHSVLNALDALASIAADDDWVLVHDAARPCLQSSDLDKLITQLSGHPVGGLLALPLHDTVKRASSSRQVVETLPREALWRAFTPQMFRYSLLRTALTAALDAGARVTDEASAVEFYGESPMLVEGAPDNIKITRPEDLALAAFYLSSRMG